eukprot:gene4217-7554_t
MNPISTTETTATKAVADVNWNLLFQIDQWYINQEVLTQHWQSLLISFGVVFICFIIFIIGQKMGINTQFWKGMKFSKYSIFNSPHFNLFWSIFYFPLAIGSWLIWINTEEKWSNSMTIYFAHLAVNALFSTSLWWSQDLSLALLNLLILLGVAMFTTNQFSFTLPFASLINTPYLFWLLYLFIDFCYVWWINEGKEAMAMVKGNAGGVIKKKTAAMPDELKEKLRTKVLNNKIKKNK